jgi:hypothetical protein
MKQVWVNFGDLRAGRPSMTRLVAITHAGHGDAGPEVDELVAVGVDEDAAPPATT